MHEQDVCEIRPESKFVTTVKRWLGIAPGKGASACYPKKLYILTGAVMGVAGVVLSLLGNPANTGFCVSCFLENIAGSLGLHGNIRMQFIRPEIIGFVLGSFFT